MVKRVIAVPGDRVSMHRNHLTVNGVSITYTLDTGITLAANIQAFATQIANSAAMAAVVTAAEVDGELVLTSARPGTPINSSATTPTNTGGVTLDVANVDSGVSSRV